MTNPEIADQQAQLERTISEALEHAAALGASQAEASASWGAGLSVTVRRQETETLEYHRDKGLSVTVYLGKRKGSANTSDLGADAVRETVMKACSMARFGAEDEYAGLAEADAMAREFPDLHRSEERRVGKEW